MAPALRKLRREYRHSEPDMGASEACRNTSSIVGRPARELDVTPPAVRNSIALRRRPPGPAPIEYAVHTDRRPCERVPVPNGSRRLARAALRRGALEVRLPCGPRGRAGQARGGRVLP